MATLVYNESVTVAQLVVLWAIVRIYANFATLLLHF